MCLRPPIFFIYGAVKEIIDNAFKYTNSGEIDVRTSVKNQHLIITITDNGEGINTSELTKIFHAYYQTASTTNNNTIGLGLGLSKAQQYMCHIQGKISVVSRSDEGSQFTVSVQLNSDSQMTAH